MPIIVWWAASRVSGVMSSDTPRCASVRRFSGQDVAQRSQPRPYMLHLRADAALPGRETFQRGCGHLGFQLQIEVVQQIGLGLEIGEERSVETPASWAIAAVAAPSPRRR